MTKSTSKIKAADAARISAANRAREERQDELDEELEMEIDDERLAKLVSGKTEPDPDAIDRALRSYERNRARDIGVRLNGVDILNRSLLIHALPVDFARAVALNVFSAIGPLRRALMREGVTPHGSTPKLMRAHPPRRRRPASAARAT